MKKFYAVVVFDWKGFGAVSSCHVIEAANKTAAKELALELSHATKYELATITVTVEALTKAKIQMLLDAEQKLWAQQQALQDVWARLYNIKTALTIA